MHGSLDDKTGLSKIFYDKDGHETNKNALQMFRGTPFQADHPAFFSPVFGWIMFGTNLDTGEVITCGKQCKGTPNKPTACEGHQMGLPFRDPERGVVQW